jgi:Zn finger protein HypA/HybF involved in hydrogenase expression
MSLRNRTFICELCSTKFIALTTEHEAGMCPKCRDSEWVIRYNDYQTVPHDYY